MNTKTKDNTAEQDYSHRCLTCKHWDGDKKQQWKEIKERGHVCMEDYRGWPRDGECGCLHVWADNEITGDAYAILMIQANHGCRHWDPEEDKEP